MSDARAGREAGRRLWWAVLRTERDRRLAVAMERPITLRNLRRLLTRRLGDLAAYSTILVINAGLWAGKEIGVSASSNDVTPLTYDVLRKAVESAAAALRCRRALQPAGGPGDKVFPPTYAGAVYAVEQRRVPGRDQPVTCVVLDSVQSQANRMEEALQSAIDEGLIELPYVTVDFSKADLIDKIDRVTSFEAPHRLADAILRDSELKGKPFRESDKGKKLDLASERYATPLFELSLNTLVYGMWDSAGSKGGLGAKFERAIVSEVVALDVAFGVKTASRIDPLAIAKSAGPLYRAKAGGWTLNPTDAVPGKSPGTFVLHKQKKNSKTGKMEDVEHKPDPGSAKYPDQGTPSAANHGNVTPSFAKYTGGAEGPDVMNPVAFTVDLNMAQETGSWQTRQRFDSSIREAKEGGVAPGGVTCASIEQTTTLSLIQLRRLRFPAEASARATAEQNAAARAMLAAIAIAGATLAFESGADLRSRCVVFPEEPMAWDLLDKPGQSPLRYALDREEAIALLKSAAAAVTKSKLPWDVKPLVLTPSKSLVELVLKSQELTAKSVDGNGGE